MIKHLLCWILYSIFFGMAVMGQEMIVVDGQLVKKKLEVDKENAGVSFKSLFDQISFEEAVIKAKQQDNKVLIYFTATFCGACRVMEKVKFLNDSIPDVIRSLYIPVFNNHDSCGIELENVYNVHAFPTFIIVDNKKEVVKRHIGRMEIPDLTKFLSIHSK